ncbi:antitoxin [Pasteurellaceae bacterium 15-036681]|nr:antitoxin [Pasteurellaceae bacterium 15-036681]
MSRTTSVTLGEPLNHFIQQMVESGRYGSTSEVVRSALRLLEEKEQQLLQLRKMVNEGLESGESSATVQDIMARVRKDLNV